MNKKGNVTRMAGIFAGLVVFVIAVLVIVLIAAPFLNAFGSITSAFTSLKPVGPYNLTSYGVTTFGNINSSLQQLRWISLVIIFGMMIGIFISFFLVKQNPWWFGVYVILCVPVIAFSLYIERAYENIVNLGGPLSTTLTTFTGTNWLLLNLPIVTTTIAVIGAIFLFTAIPRPGDGGF
jgi:hypothetical protein